MHIDAQAVFAGQPILQIRKLLRRARARSRFTQRLIADVLGVDGATAAVVLRSLFENGYIERPKGATTDGEWRTTVKGNALAQASAGLPVTRATAGRAIDGLLQRVRQINAAEEFAYVVEQVILFGSYLGDAPTVNDVDVALQLRRRSDDDARYLRQSSERIAYALDQGRVFRNITERVMWPRLEICLLLKSGSRVIKLHDAELEASLLRQGPTRVVYPEPSEEFSS